MGPVDETQTFTADKKGGFKTNDSLGEERASKGSKKSRLCFCVMKKFKFKLWSPSNLRPNPDSVTSVMCDHGRVICDLSEPLFSFS